MELPEAVSSTLEVFVTEAKKVFLDRLVSIVLYGSAAEGKLRKTSDVNVVLVTKSFLRKDAEDLNGILTLSASAIDLQVMFLLENELETASQVFAVKFADIAKRRKVLFGSDPFDNLKISKEALVARLRQVLLNHLLRMRYAFALNSHSPEELNHTLAEGISALRASAAGVQEIRGVPFENPKDALEAVAKELREDGYRETLALISETREGRPLPVDKSSTAVADILELTARMKELIKALR